MTNGTAAADSKHLTIVALHGNGGGGFRFERMHQYVPPNVTLMCPTLPGFATEPKDPALKTLAQFADTLHPIVSRAKGRIVLLGHGIGGSIALDYLQRHADSVSGLILHAPVGAMLDKRIFPVLLRLPGVACMGQQIFSWPILRPFFAKKLFKHPVPEDFLARFFGEYAHCKVFADMFFLISHDWFTSLQTVQTPTIVLWGEQDNVLSAKQLESFLPLLTNPRIVRPPEWDHFPMCDIPEEYCKQIVTLAEELVHGQN